MDAANVETASLDELDTNLASGLVRMMVRDDVGGQRRRGLHDGVRRDIGSSRGKEDGADGGNGPGLEHESGDKPRELFVVVVRVERIDNHIGGEGG